MLKEYGHLLADDSAYTDQAKQFSSQVQDINEFLAKNMIHPPRGTINARVTFSDSCHLRNAQKVIKPPRDLLKAIPASSWSKCNRQIDVAEARGSII